jgi:GH15 family glucan-1,4-alpha-glucosidase
MSTFPPIAEYAFLSNCEAETLIAPDGSVEWLCLPRPDCPSVFGALLDRSAGFFRFAPSSTQVPSQRRYLPGTNVLETTWHTPMGWCVVRDALIVGPSDNTERRQGYRRAPGDTCARDILLRIAECRSGRVEIECDALPLFEYGSKEAYWDYEGDGYEHAKVTVDDVTLDIVSGMQLNVSGARVRGRTLLEQGQSTWVALAWGGYIPQDLDDALEQLQNTEHFWRTWLSAAQIPDHRFRPLIERSALALKGLSYAPTGAILAAATTSLPETPGGERNWDYRYTWIRDSAFMLRALHRLGFDWEAIEYFAFVLDAIREPVKEGESPLQIMYGIDGRRDLTEQTLDNLSGYRQSRPVRIGNGAYDQRQHDVWGMLLDSVHSHVRAGGQIGLTTWTGLAYLVDVAIEASSEPDQGIWEMRGPPQHFVASKVMCWVAVDRGIKLALDRDDHDRAAKWQKAADAMKDEICTKGVDERGVFVQHYGGKELDASALLLVLMGFLPGDDDRIRATVLAIAEELTQDGLVLRYRLDSADDGLSNEAEGTFTICSFWLVSALAMIGEIDRARELFEKLISFAGPLLLYAEEIDATTGLHLGNFPQAFTHLALMDAANRLIECEAVEPQ